MTQIRTSGKDLAALRAEVSACFAYDGDREPRGIADPALRKELAVEMRAEKFKGHRGDVVSWNADGRFGSRRFLVIGLGKDDLPVGEAVRTGCARAATAARKIRARTLALRLPEAENDRAVPEVRAAVEGAILGAYRFDRYLHDPDRTSAALKSIEVSSDVSTGSRRKAANLGEVTARSVCFARDLVNEPPSRLDPPEMAKRAVKAARESGLAAKVLGPVELKRLGMKALLSVSRAGGAMPRVVHLAYRPARKRRNTEKIVLVGKGVTFDSGGLHLKPGNFMNDMKCDMAGSAAVLGAMTALRDVGCNAEVHGLLGLVENMPGPHAYKPGDILDTYAGKTVEIGNTDAEGRLVMCDLLAYAARRIRPGRMVDLATLTGACVVALGTQAAGVFTRHETLRDELLEAAREGGEKFWPMPMYEEYLAELQKGPSDLRNVGGRYGGAITAALFLGEFVPRDLPWAHVDIAGPAFVDEARPDVREGGTGAGVSALVRWLESF